MEILKRLPSLSDLNVLNSSDKHWKSMCVFKFAAKVHLNIYFLKFPTPIIPGSCVSTHLFLTINSSINSISISRHCCQMEAFSSEMFESWMELENLKMELIYAGGALRSNWCSPLFLLLCGEILILIPVVFSPPPTWFKKNKCIAYKPGWYYYGSAAVVFAMTLAANVVFLEWSQKVSWRFSNKLLETLLLSPLLIQL